MSLAADVSSPDQELDVPELSAEPLQPPLLVRPSSRSRRDSTDLATIETSRDSLINRVRNQVTQERRSASPITLTRAIALANSAAAANQSSHSQQLLNDESPKASPGQLSLYLSCCLTSEFVGAAVRRIAESFLADIDDSSNSASPVSRRRVLRSRRQPSNTLEASAFVEEHVSRSPSRNSPRSSSMTPRGGTVADSPVLHPPSSPLPIDNDDIAFAEPLSLPTVPPHWIALEEEIQACADYNAAASDRQRHTRLELIRNVTSTINSIWPNAQVHVVGSMPAGVALPRSDIDFVISFPQGDALKLHLPNAPLNSENLNAAPDDDEVDDDDAPTNLSQGHDLSHFPPANVLIKLIGGRKRCKLLFHSTKLQVFKDISLIRLRDGASGLSFDLWFPLDPITAQRSQDHVKLLQQAHADHPQFCALAILIKSFMQQHQLNSGYSGLGSFGVELMLLSYLNWRFSTNRSGRSRAISSITAASFDEIEAADSTPRSVHFAHRPSTAVPHADLLLGFFRFFSQVCAELRVVFSLRLNLFLFFFLTLLDLLVRLYQLCYLHS